MVLAMQRLQKQISKLLDASKFDSCRSCWEAHRSCCICSRLRASEERNFGPSDR